MILGFSADGQMLISYAAANASPAASYGAGDVASYMITSQTLWAALLILLLSVFNVFGVDILLSRPVSEKEEECRENTTKC